VLHFYRIHWSNKNITERHKPESTLKEVIPMKRFLPIAVIICAGAGIQYFILNTNTPIAMAALVMQLIWLSILLNPLTEHEKKVGMLELKQIKEIGKRLRNNTYRMGFYGVLYMLFFMPLIWVGDNTDKFNPVYFYVFIQFTILSFIIVTQNNTISNHIKHMCKSAKTKEDFKIICKALDEINECA